MFCWLFCILVVAAFADVVADTFDGFVKAADGASYNLEASLANGRVAMTSMLFIAAAVGLGVRGSPDAL